MSCWGDGEFTDCTHQCSTLVIITRHWGVTKR